MPRARTSYGNPNDPAGPAALRLTGPQIEVIVRPPVAPGQPPQPATPLAERRVWALIDTGASDGCIEDTLAAALGLLIIDRRIIEGVGGQRTHNVYLARLSIPALNMDLSGGLIGVHLTPPAQVILGRDFLMHTVFIYDGGGAVTIVCN